MERAISELRKIASSHNFPFLLESGFGDGHFIFGANPFLVVKGMRGKVSVNGKLNYTAYGDPLKVLKKVMNKFKHFFAVGYLSYDYCRYIEKLPNLARNDLQLPELFFALFSSANVFKKKGRKTKPRETRKKIKRFCDILTSNFTKEGFEKIVRKAKNYIRNGDIFQVNLSQRFAIPTQEDPINIYERLQSINPSPFSAYMDFGEFQLISSSPERLVRVYKNEVSTRPFAGTRKRGKGEEDERLKKELLENEKEIAEHIMLVDLARNDIGKVSEFGSVVVDELCSVERYSHVQHLVSNVKGKLAKDKDYFDVLRAVFPGGTITGAPKVRAMEIIEELEPTKRGPYTGSLGYISSSGNIDFNILIRTIILKKGIGYVQVGAGIVNDSVPHREYNETLYKAKAMLNAIKGF